MGHEITNIWNGRIISHENGHYDIKNCGYNSNISVGGSVSFGFQASITDKNIALLPTNGVLKQVSENNTVEPDQDWSQRMIHADAENVIAARNQVNSVVKIALIDSGVDYSEEVNVVARKNFIPDYAEEDLNPLFDDLSGHGSAAAALIASDSSQPVVEDDGTVGDGVIDDNQESNVDFSFLTEDDKITLTPELDEDLVQFLADQGEVTYVNNESSTQEEAVIVGEETVTEVTEDMLLLEEQELLDLDELMSTPINGINPNAQIYSARVLDHNNEAPVSRVIEAIEWAIEQKVNIINLSWGIDEDNAELRAVIKKAYHNGILIIAAAGNGVNIQYPAKYAEVIAVGSIKCTGGKADDSATGDELEIVAPGQDVVSYGPFGIPDMFSGTSMAAPQVTGLASILWQKDLTKSNEFIRQLIDATAKDLGDKNIYGYGLIDCEYAVSQYDEFANTYIENSAIEENIYDAIEDGTLVENNTEIDTFAEATIKGCWINHKELVNEMKVVRDGAYYVDQPESGFKDKGPNPGFHGAYACDYIAAYIYLTQQAVSYYNTGEPIKDYSSNDKGMTAMHKQFIDNIDKAWKNYPQYDTEIEKYKFIYGMALHTVGDIFAHSAFTYEKYKAPNATDKYEVSVKNIIWKQLTHGEKIDGKWVGNEADSTEVYDQRYECAKAISKKILAFMTSELNKIEEEKKIEEKKKVKEQKTIIMVNCGTVSNFYSSTYDGININNVKDDVSARWTYLQSGFGIKNYEEYICGKIENKDNHKALIKNIQKVSLSSIKKVAKNWSIVYIKFSDTLKKKIDSKKATFTVYKKDGTGKKITAVKKDDNYILVLDKNVTYILQVKVGKKVIGEEEIDNEEIELFSFSDTAERYVCTKELYINDDNQEGYLESENYKTMCLGNELVLEESDFVTATLEGRITIADTDSYNGNDEVLSDAEITLIDYNDDSYQTTATSDGQGKYVFSDLAPGIYIMTIQKEGYIDTQYTVIVHSNEDNVFNPVIAMISKNYEGIGNASGNVVDSITSDGVDGLTLRFRKGLNETKDTILMEIKTGADGFYSVENLTAGYYTVQIIDERNVDEEVKYQGGIMIVRILGGYTLDNQNGVVSNGLIHEQLRIVLSWGAAPSDLDSHLLGVTSDGMRCHMYYANKVITNSQNVVEFELDLDDTTSYGPETTTIYQPINDNYEFYVYNFSSGSDQELMNSGAMVQVYRGSDSKPWYTFYVPQQQGYYWNVFSYNGGTGKLTPYSEITMENRF